MFSFNKTVVCVEFSKTSVFCALAQISGRKVDIIAIDSIQIESGILEEGVIYDVPHLQQIVKNLVTSVSKSQNKIDAAWLAIPDNKVLITKFEVEKDKKGINEYELHKAIEEKFNFSASKLFLINRPIHELNRKVFFLTNAIRIDNLEPFMELFEPLNIPVESIFPTFQCIYEDLKEQFVGPTLLLHPADKGFKFFLADSNGVHLESVWGHNVIEFNENFDKAIDEVVQYAKQSKETALGVKKIYVIESPKFDSDLVQSYLQRTGIDFSWIPSGGSEDAGYDPISVVTLKGLIKACMASDFNQGFLMPQVTQIDDKQLTPPPPANPGKFSLPTVDVPPANYSPTAYTTPATRSTVVKSSAKLSNNWNVKVVVASILLGVALLALLGYMGKKISDKVSTNKTPSTVKVTTTPKISPTAIPNAVAVSPTLTLTPTVSGTPVVTGTPSVTVTPTPGAGDATADLAKTEIAVQVLNGNFVTGEAQKITGILKGAGFQTKAPGNNPVKGVQTTKISYKDPRAKKLADEIVTLIEPSYPSAQSVNDPNLKDDILVVLGAR